MSFRPNVTTTGSRAGLCQFVSPSLRPRVGDGGDVIENGPLPGTQVEGPRMAAMFDAQQGGVDYRFPRGGPRGDPRADGSAALRDAAARARFAPCRATSAAW